MEKIDNGKEILFIFNGTVGVGMSGGDMHAINLANELSKKYRVDVLLPENTYEKKFNKEINIINFKNIDSHLSRNNILIFFQYCRRIMNAIKEVKKDKYAMIIPASHLFFDTLPLVFAHKKNTTAFVHHIIGEQKRTFLHHIVTSNLEKISFIVLRYKKSLIFVDSSRIKMSLVNKYSFNLKLVVVTRNGIDLNFIKSIKVDKKKYDFVFCGRLNHTKGIYDLIQIIIQIKRKREDVSLIVIGDGPEKERFINEIKKNNLQKNIHLFGYLNEVQKIRKIKESNVFLMPSHEEGWGIVIGESLASKVPVIAYRLDDIVNIWKENVIWVTPFDINKFSIVAEKARSRVNLIKLNHGFIKKIDWREILENEISIIERKSKLV